MVTVRTSMSQTQIRFPAVAAAVLRLLRRLPSSFRATRMRNPRRT